MVSRWRREQGRWVSDLGAAHSRQKPPESDPLTAAEVQALPEGSRIIVLWGGGNGPHTYLWRGGRVLVNEDDERGHPLGGLIGSWGLVGALPYQDKVWRGGSV